MIIGKKCVIKLGRHKFLWLVPIGDIHLKNAACSLSKLQDTLDWIAATPNCRWIGMGDYAEFIGHTDKRFDPGAVDKAMPVSDLGRLSDVSTTAVAQIFKPIASKCLGMLYGNHEDVYMLRTQQANMHKELCQKIGVQNLGYSCFQQIEFQRGNERQIYTIRAHHGAGFAQTKGGKMQALVKFCRQTDADITLVGHLHDSMQHPDQMLTLINGHIVARTRLGVMTATYLKTYEEDVTTYGEKRGYDPVPLGSPRIQITPFSNRTLGDVSWG